MNKMTFKDFLTEGYTTLPPMDRNKYREREGLEGPFSSRSGKVYYYDPAEGKYYDPDTDFYISDEDYADMDLTGAEWRAKMMGNDHGV